MQMDPNIKLVRLDLASAYVQKKMYPEAIAQWQAITTLDGDLALPPLQEKFIETPAFRLSCRACSIAFQGIRLPANMPTTLQGY